MEDMRIFSNYLIVMLSKQQDKNNMLKSLMLNLHNKLLNNVNIIKTITIILSESELHILL